MCSLYHPFVVFTIPDATQVSDGEWPNKKALGLPDHSQDTRVPYQQILKENLDVKFFAQIRTDTVAKHPEMIALGAKAGFYGALLGFDSYEDDILHHVDKTTSKELNLSASHVLRKNNIAIFGCHIYGLPGQGSPLRFYRTWNMGRKHSDLFRMPHFTPLPFTEGYETYVQSFKEDDGTFIPRVGENKKIERLGYNVYNWAHNLSPSEIFGAIAHPNPVVRTFKRRGYVGVFRVYAHKILRTLGIGDI